MKKEILVIYYSQTGQLGEILNSFCAPLFQHYNVDFVHIKPENDFPFPWSADEFFATMPDTVLGRSIPMSKVAFKKDKYDLVVFGYQPWFLSPSLPATSILELSEVTRVLKNTPVITIIGARNMWLNAQEIVKQKLSSCEANLVGNIPLVDRNNNLSSAVSIVYWLIYGKKEKLWGVFPTPGVANEDVNGISKWGELASKHLEQNDWTGFQQKIIDQHGIVVRTNIMFIEKRAPRLFAIWAKTIDGRKKKDFWLKAFKFYLFFALFVVSPILLLVYNVLIVPLSFKAIKERKKYYQGLSLK